MSANIIVGKINSLCEDQLFTWDEPKVLYFMVQLRKLFEQHETVPSKFVRFFLDWCVHTEKRHNVDDIRPLLEELDQGLQQNLKSVDYKFGIGPEIITKFVYFNSFMKELEIICKNFGITYEKLEDELGVDFICSLVKILEDQPLIVPKHIDVNIRSLVFHFASERAAILNVLFRNKVKTFTGEERRSYKYGNHFGLKII